MTDTITRAEETDAPRRSRMAPIIAVLLLAALAFTVSGVFPFRQLFQQQRQVEETRERLQQLVDENDALASEIEALQTDEEIERLAREHYGLVRPGETAFVVVVPDPRAGGEVAPAEEQVPALPWWQRLWNFVTGGDAVADG